MIVLGLETSCDETSVALVEDGRTVLSCETVSSLAEFEKKGGVIPEYAARAQVSAVIPVLSRALKAASIDMRDIDLIAVTRGPGLLGSLLVGTVTARVLSEVFAIPLIAVHHTHGHLSSPWLCDALDASPPRFPALTLSVSGGHTDLWLRASHCDNTLLGSTLDDAAGEAFDKGATLLGLPYPGGPSLAQFSLSGDEDAYAFPSPLERSHSLDFSFSGLKTSLKYVLRDLGTRADLPSVAASYQLAICNHLVSRLQMALERHSSVNDVHVVGGVAANSRLRALLTERLPSSIALRYPHSRYCTDNGAMIAASGYFQWMSGIRTPSFVTETTLSSITR